ncbi:MAG: hypothetical protein ACQEW8_10725 [Actinomycetota bacterium]
MSLTHLNDKIDQIRAQATETWNEHKGLETFVNGNPNLSPSGKKAEIDRSLQDTRRKLKELEQREIGEFNNKRRAAEEALNRTSGSASQDIISFRDAQDRAERLENSRDANQVMDRAIASKDTTLATAVMRHAVGNGWSDVYDRYAAEYPATAEHIADLATINRYENSPGAMIERFVYELGGS